MADLRMELFHPSGLGVQGGTLVGICIRLAASPGKGQGCCFGCLAFIDSP